MIEYVVLMIAVFFIMYGSANLIGRILDKDKLFPLGCLDLTTLVLGLGGILLLIFGAN